MKTFPVLFMIASASMASACMRDIHIDSYTSTEPVLCLVSRMSDTDEIHDVFLAVSSGSKLTCPPEDTMVELWKDGNLLAATDTLWSEPNLQIHRLKASLKPGADYTIVATAGPLRAHSTVSAVSRYNGTAYLCDSSSVRDFMGFRDYNSIQICIEDVPGDRNYYWLDNAVYGEIRYIKGGEVVDNNIDRCGNILLKPYIGGGMEELLGIENVSGGDMTASIFSDYAFQDGVFYINTSFTERYLSHYDLETLQRNAQYDSICFSMKLRLGMINSEDYDYCRLRDYHGADLFYEPVLLSDNIDGGIGHFAIVSFSQINIPVNDIFPE